MVDEEVAVKTAEVSSIVCTWQAFAWLLLSSIGYAVIKIVTDLAAHFFNVKLINVRDDITTKPATREREELEFT